MRIGRNVVKLTLLKNTYIVVGSINPPDICEDNKLKIASLLDLLASKILALHDRREAKDYVDIVELIKHGISLQSGFEAALVISMLSRFGTDQLMLDMIRLDLLTFAPNQ